jgi:hypothetical protein
VALEFGFLILPTPRPGNTIDRMTIANDLLPRFEVAA